MSRPIRHVVVAGGDTAAWIAAAALLRAMGHRQVQVTVVDVGPSPDAPVGYWTLPSQRGIHAMLGIHEVAFMTRTGATFRLGSEHLGWHGADSRFVHVHADMGVELGTMPFFKFLQMQALAGHSEDPAHYSVAGVAARNGKFARPMGDSKSLTSAFTYGFHLPASGYRDFVRAHALGTGVRQVTGDVAALDRDPDGSITAIRLAGGEAVTGDLFVDATGTRALLASQLGDDVEDWSQWLPCDRHVSSLAAAAEAPPAVTRITASDAGWTWWAPLVEASMVGHVYHSGSMSDEAALAALRRASPELRGELAVRRFRAGRRVRPWRGNCVAIGDAAMQLEPLVGAELHFAQLGVGMLVELFPLDTQCRIEAAEYNRVLKEECDALRDFTLAHYLVGAPREGAFWSTVRAVEPPARLKHKLDLYAATGRINLLDHEAFEEVDWAWLMLGNRVLPDALEAQTRMELEKTPPGEIQAMRQHVARLASTMPRHIDFLRYQLQQQAARGGPR